MELTSEKLMKCAVFASKCFCIEYRLKMPWLFIFNDLLMFKVIKSGISQVLANYLYSIMENNMCCVNIFECSK